MYNTFEQDLAVWIYTTKNSTQYPVTTQDICGFSLFSDCWVGGPQYEWTLDLDFLGPKPTPETPQLPQVKYKSHETKMEQNLIKN